MRKRKRRLLGVVCVLLAVYIGSYLWLSRRAYAAADQYGMQAFYYFSPEESDTWRFKNYGCVALFWPLNMVDWKLGFGRYPASEPLWGLSR
jgi:hypothetical protein